MKLNKTTMNTPLGKQIISLVRDGDYAHPGSEEAIDMVFKDISPNPDRLLLDVGSGLGGTADYLQRKGYGKITGLELDIGILNAAKKNYPNLNFVHGNVIDAGKIFKEKFDLIYHFCSFYVFPDKLQALKAVREVAHDQTELIIYDYAVNGYKRGPGIVSDPLELGDLDEMLRLSNWKKQSCLDISDYYRENYKEFIARIKQRKDEIIKISDEESYEFFLHAYSGLYKDYRDGNILAVILKAVAIP